MDSKDLNKKKEDPNNIADNIDSHNEERERAFKAILKGMETYLSDLYIVQKLPVEGLEDMLRICLWPVIVQCTKAHQKIFSELELFRLMANVKIIGLKNYPPEKVDILMEYLKTGVLYVCEKVAVTGLERTYQDWEIFGLALSFEISLERITKRPKLH